MAAGAARDAHVQDTPLLTECVEDPPHEVAAKFLGQQHRS
jgi:hypothetical protein